MAAIAEVDPELIAKTCGSYRRGAPTSGDIDVLITHPKYTEQSADMHSFLDRVVQKLEKGRLLTDTLSHGKKKYMGIGQLPQNDNEEEASKHRRVDLRMIPYESYYCGLLYFTGSDFFNQQMRTIALEKEFTLSEYSICPIGENGVIGGPLPVNSENDIFDYLGMKYKEPKDRNL